MNRDLNADPPPLPALALSADADAPRRRLPFSKWQPFLCGAGAAFGLRLLFSGMPGQRYSAMLGAFIYLVPVLCGAVTVYVAERSERRSWGYYIVAPWVATALFVSGTLLVYIEGIICAIVIVPMFATMGSLGGLVMGMVCRVTNWPKQAIYSFAMLPLVLGALEPMLPEPDLYSATTRTLFVAAPPERIWHELNDVQNIRPGEVGDAWAWRIGVPMPVAGVTEQTPEGQVRKSTWQKNVHFDELVTEWSPPHRLRWRYRFKPDSFPEGALDDHVLIGGHYFDLQVTAYTLTPQPGGTALTLDVRWRVSTRFNWYANRVAQFLLGDFSEQILGFYKLRSEAVDPT